MKTTNIVQRRTKSDELFHHGVKGQKWGVRRYQNKDGSLTPDGRVHYYGKNSTSDGLTDYKITKNNNVSRSIKIGKTTYVREKDFPNLGDGSEYDTVGTRTIHDPDPKQDKDHSHEAKRRSKLTNKQTEQELRDIRDNSENDNRANKLMREIERYSGDYYKSTYVTDKNKESLRKLTRLSGKLSDIKDKYGRKSAEYQEINKRYKQAANEHLGVVLKDLGYKDSTVARELIYDLVYLD